MENILKGKEYIYYDKNLNDLRIECKSKCFEYNVSIGNDSKKQNNFIKSIINTKNDNFYINKKFNCNFGKNIFIGDNFYSSFNLTIVDENSVKFGDNIYLGPNCTFNTINTPLDKNKRKERIISANEIIIGNNIYFEGSITVLSGVKIGDNVIIKAGSLIDKDIPCNSLVEGNPCKVIKSDISFNFNNYIKSLISKESTDQNIIEAKKICDEFNNSKFENFEKINDIISKLFKTYKSLFLTQNAHIQNGKNTSVGEVFYTNYNYILIDSSEFSTGDNVLFAQIVS